MDKVHMDKDRFLRALAKELKELNEGKIGPLSLRSFRSSLESVYLYDLPEEDREEVRAILNHLYEHEEYMLAKETIDELKPTEPERQSVLAALLEKYSK